MDLERVSAAELGAGLRGLGLNLLVRDAGATAAFLADVFGMKAHRVSRDFAVMAYGGALFQLHADATFASHPLHGLLPEAGVRGAGIELRLYETDPDEAWTRAAAFPGAILLRDPRDRPHGLREAVILCSDGYAWVPSRPLVAAG